MRAGGVWPGACAREGLRTLLSRLEPHACPPGLEAPARQGAEALEGGRLTNSVVDHGGPPPLPPFGSLGQMGCGGRSAAQGCQVAASKPWLVTMLLPAVWVRCSSASCAFGNRNPMAEAQITD